MAQLLFKILFYSTRSSRGMKPEAINERFMEGLAFSLLIVVLNNIVSLFLVAGSQQGFEDSSPHPFFKEESLIIRIECASKASTVETASKEGLIPPPFSNTVEIGCPHYWII
ncbi:MAG: hypothetical protein N3F08_04215 [Crenarchaeota archaeon]|nr:hypothetical protein [Thermoproteota archaeon]